MPRDDRIEFLFGPGKQADEDSNSWGYSKESNTKKQDVFEWLKRLKEEIRNNPGDSARQTDLKCLCNIVTSRTRLWNSLSAIPCSSKWNLPAPYPVEALAAVIATALALNDEEMLLGACEAFSENIEPDAYRPLGVALLRFKSDTLRHS